MVVQTPSWSEGGGGGCYKGERVGIVGVPQAFLLGPPLHPSEMSLFSEILSIY